MTKLEIQLDGRTVATIDLAAAEPAFVEPADRERALKIVREASAVGLSRGEAWQKGRRVIVALDVLVASGEIVAVKEPRSRPGARATRYFAREFAP